MNLQCVISDPFKREHKRRRLSELERETSALRRQLQTHEVADSSSPTSMLLAAAQLDAMSRPLTLPSPEVARAASTGRSSGPPLLSSAPIDPALAGPAHPISADSTFTTIGDTQEPTLPRRLESVELDGRTIDGIFDLYYRRYHPWLPIFNHSGRPNFIFTHSPFLFWAIIGIGVRRYPADPSVMKALSSSIIDMALMSMKQRDMSLSTIKGLLLVVAWPFPKNGITSDVTFAIAGALPHLAMQLGLHHPTATQDFARVRIKLTEAEIIRRAELWAWCVIVYQRLSSLMGQTPFILVDTVQDIEQRRRLIQSLSPSLKLQLDFQNIVCRACKALLENGLQIMSNDQERAMSVLLGVFIAQIKDLEYLAVNAMDQLFMHVSYMNLLVFYFYKSNWTSDAEAVTQLFLRSNMLLEHVDRMDKDSQVLGYAPYQVIAGTIIASYTLLRLLKTSASRFLEVERAKSSFFLSLNISKRLIVDNDDLPSRNLQLLTLLWNSEKAFKDADGSEFSTLRIRSRLAMSPVFDAVWWWRTEFGGQSGAYPPAEVKSEPPLEAPATNSTSEGTGQSIESVQQPTPQQSLQQQPMPLLEDTFFSDLGWAFDDNFFLSDFSLEPTSNFEQYGLNGFTAPPPLKS
ncbi:hypothetical protein NA57DRAFT_71993 [Rhizodiscina lignyota]|uniref:Transcription factor domain-containing protein n=1 Tax=Rhizodiscina lignyota TaxID=1504668 RepID=A0A9P4IK27_9PEZI|nr:hypothetical protein NA57DRAFT_71993 [Rhizodiscina lignyota]